MTIPKIAYYKEKDWNRLLLIIDNKESMHDSWDEWHLSYRKAKNELIAKGFQVVDVEIKFIELVSYCNAKGAKILTKHVLNLFKKDNQQSNQSQE